MKKINLKSFILYFILFLVIFLTLNLLLIPDATIGELRIHLSAKQDDHIQLYYKEENGNGFDEMHSKFSTVSKEEDAEILIDFPAKSQELRLDFGNVVGNVFQIKSIEIRKERKSLKLLPVKLYSLIDSQTFLKNQMEVSKEEKGLSFTITGEDPYILLSLDNLEPINRLPSIAIAFFLSILLFCILYKYVNLKEVYLLTHSILAERKLLFSLGCNDFKVKYSGSYFGVIWAFVQPICTILIFWFVFEFGLKSFPIGDVPFALWLSAGLIPWFFFSEAWNSATNAFVEYSYLVKKVVFKIDILPLVKIFSSFIVHLFFVAFLVIIYAVNGIYPEIRMLGILYYMICMTILVMSLSFITASIVVFFKDLTQIMNIILQILMWLTPIMWNIDMLPLGLIRIFKLNPMFYIIQGYRNCMIGNASIFPSLNQTMYFWLVAMLLFFVGICLFRKLKVHFADVL